VFALKTPRLILAPYQNEEADEVYAAIVASEEHLAPYIGLFALRDQWAGDPVALLRLLRGEGRPVNKLELSFRDKNTRRFLGGGCIIRDLPDGGPTELGYWLLHDALGQGFATEATRALAEFVLSTEPAVRLEIETTNTPSVRLAERLGFKRAGPCELPWPDGSVRPGLAMIKRAAC
jgi:RimJ/RimL family protein N-acetyltransferase